MKTTFTKLFFAITAILVLKTQAQTDLVPGINYSYNPPGANGIITDIEIDVCNNESSYSFSFDVSMYLYDQNSGDHWVIGTYNSSGVSGFSCNTISNWDIDINNTSGIPTGVYRLGIWADSDDDISETDENNNTGLLAGNINYTASAVGIKQAFGRSFTLNDALPNPASGSATLSFQTNSSGKVSLEIFDISGKLVQSVVNAELAAGDHTYKTDLSTLEPGMYFYTLMFDQQKSTRKLIVQ